MERKTRRWMNNGLLGVSGVVVAVVAGAGTFVGQPEQVDSYWLQAQVSPDGSAKVSEVVDYDFAAKPDKHGIYRVVPGLAEGSVRAYSPNAPDSIDLTDEAEGTRIRIGSPFDTVSGEHRHTVDYELEPGEVTSSPS